jgi:protein-disulfide isomerase
MTGGKLDFCLSRQLLAYKKQDPPPKRVKPIPFPIIAHATNFCHQANTAFAHALADMLLLGFYFLL